MACLDLLLKMIKRITIDLLALSFRFPFFHALYVALQIEMVLEIIVRTTTSRSTGPYGLDGLDSSRGDVSGSG